MAYTKEDLFIFSHEKSGSSWLCGSVSRLSSVNIGVCLVPLASVILVGSVHSHETATEVRDFRPRCKEGGDGQRGGAIRSSPSIGT